MAAQSQAEGFNQFLRTHTRLVDGLLAKTEAAHWGLTRARFAEALHRSTEHRFRGASPRAAEVAAYLESLHIGDLALACACGDGNEQAWEHFFRHYREQLYAAARAIIGGRGQAAGASEAQARELADSIYAELYGLGPREVQRRSLFDYFHGRSKLSTWLRAVLAQRHIDALRAAQRTEPLEEKDEAYIAEILRARGSPVPQDPERARYLTLLQATLLEALAALDARDRLRLAYYYVQELTLAEIGRLLGEHEATASRHLERTRRELRRQVERALAGEKRLSEAQIRLCFEYALEEWPFDLTGALDAAKAQPERGPAPVRKLQSPAPKPGED
jgi:RNA polymerase sigma-70 factor (ECF subfamily)